LYLQTSEAVWLYMLRYNIIIFLYILLVVIFSASCVCLDILCTIRCSQFKSAIM